MDQREPTDAGREAWGGEPAPPPLPAAKPRRRKTLWLVLGGVAVVVLALGVVYVLAVWKMVEKIAEGGALVGPAGRVERPLRTSTGPVNRRSPDKGSTQERPVYTAQIDAALAAVAGAYENAGYTVADAVEPDLLAAGGSYTVELYFPAGAKSVVLGLCDADCTDLDLTLFDENDNVVDQDFAVDAGPVVEVVPEWSGQFYVSVDMVDCLAADCLWSLVVYRRDAPPATTAPGVPSAPNPKAPDPG